MLLGGYRLAHPQPNGRMCGSRYDPRQRAQLGSDVEGRTLESVSFAASSLVLSNSARVGIGSPLSLATQDVSIRLGTLEGCLERSTLCQFSWALKENHTYQAVLQ